MNDMMKDPMFFYGIAFVIFLTLAFRYGRKPMLDWLDSGILKIRTELEEAKALRAEAETLLADYKSKQVAAMADAEAIIAHAKDEAERLRTQATADLKAALARHEQQASERIRMAEAEAMAAVRTAVIDSAMKLAQETLAGKMNADTATKLVDQAIADVPKLSGTKAKAA